jgi:hypothetical protein
VVELAVRGRSVGALLPALHVLGIGSVALALAVLVARRSLGSILGLPPEPEAPSTLPEELVADRPAAAPSPAMARLIRAMTEELAYRREGLTLAELARTLEVGEAVLRRLINQELGYSTASTVASTCAPSSPAWPT